MIFRFIFDIHVRHHVSGNVNAGYVVLLPSFVLQIGQNPLTTEGAKALISAVMSAPDVEITELDITVNEPYILLPFRIIIYLLYVFKSCILRC